MGQATSAGRSSAGWRTRWVAAILALAAVAGLLFVAGPALAWAASAALAAPLLLAAALALLLLPGLALLRLLWPGALAISERWPLAIALSCALLPVLLLVSSLAGLRWNGWMAWGLLLASGAVAFWPGRGRPSLDGWRTMPHLLLLAMTAAALLIRLYVARDLPAGLWGDSYQHTVMAQLIADHGGLFSSWQPYAQLRTFTYHFGFHATAAWLHWLGGDTIPRAVVVVGQLQSALVVPLVYLLARRLIGDERSALWAALLAGFVSILPAYYLNWGRYTQLAGQTVLPGVCMLWAALLERLPERTPQRGALARLGALTVLATAGLALTHYRVAVFGACFVAAYALYLLAARVRSWRAALALAGGAAATGALTVLLVLPWLLRLREGALLRIGDKFLSNNMGGGESNAFPPTEQIFSLYMPWYLVALALAGAGLLLWRRNWRGLTLVLWLGLTALAANPYLVGLNGAGIITNFAVLIANYLIVAPLAGVAVAEAFRLLAVPRAAALQAALGALVLLWGLSWQQGIVAPGNALLTDADLEAMAWLRRETPADARVFVNSFPAYGGTLYAGSDGGWWLPYLAGRQSNLPPLTYGSESSDPPGLQRRVNELNRAVESQPIDSDATAAALRKAGFSYLYDGPAKVNTPSEYISPAALEHSPRYTVVYRKDGVTIWKVR